MFRIRFSVAYIRQKRNVTRSLYRRGELTLMHSTCAGYSSRQYLRALADAFAKTHHVFIVDMFDLIRAESANFLAFAAVHTLTGTSRLGISIIVHLMNLPVN
jgi:hypothetical protein